ncbi:hypothetical protein EII18_04425 [Comamonadaceae bacterium OH3737_COT-264]|nr:hypothetical protein EII18_04425 [Comamonadaceae bacterium OH3737_COT-264]
MSFPKNLCMLALCLTPAVAIHAANPLPVGQAHIAFSIGAGITHQARAAAALDTPVHMAFEQGGDRAKLEYTVSKAPDRQDVYSAKISLWSWQQDSWQPAGDFLLGIRPGVPARLTSRSATGEQVKLSFQWQEGAEQRMAVRP